MRARVPGAVGTPQGPTQLPLGPRSVGAVLPGQKGWAWGGIPSPSPRPPKGRRPQWRAEATRPLGPEHPIPAPRKRRGEHGSTGAQTWRDLAKP
eukprot:14581866-Alexandrium_andersonii.AAC.1